MSLHFFGIDVVSDIIQELSKVFLSALAKHNWGDVRPFAHFCVIELSDGFVDLVDFLFI